MGSRTWKLMMGVVVALVAVLAFGSPALAQGPGGGRGAGGGMGVDQSLLVVAAQQLKMERDDLLARLQGGATIAAVAAERDVAVETIVNAFVATRSARMAAMVRAGRLTQAQADAMLATMRASVTARLSQPWAPQGPGAGAGFTDANGDGVCDNAGAGMGSGRGGMRGRGNR